jgi:hypothetical protein
VLLRATRGLNLAFVAYNVLGEDSPNYPRALAGGATFQVTPSLVIGADGVWNLDLDEDRPELDDPPLGRYGFGAEYFLVSSDKQAGFPLRVGTVWDRSLDDSVYLTGGVGWVTAKLGIDLGMRKQVDGGDELMVLGSIRVFAPVPAQ